MDDAVATDLVTPRWDIERAAVARKDAGAVAATSLSAVGVLLMVAAGAAWTAGVGALAVWRHNEFLSHRFDLGNVTQAVWSSAHGELLAVTLGSGEQAPRLASHIDPALLLFVPFWWIYPEPETLIVVQAAALAAGLYPVVRLGLKYTGSMLAASLLACWYLAYPWLVWNAVNDVHAVTLSIPFLLYAIWFLDEHRLGRFAAAAVLAMLTGELVGLTVAALGVSYLIRYRRVRAGFGIALAGVLWTTICLAFVIPAFNDGPSEFYGRFETVGGSPTGLVSTLVTNPTTILSALTTGADVAYVLSILAPTAFLAVGAPVLLIAVLPQLGVNLLAEEWSASTRPVYQYVCPIIAILVPATIIALRRFSPRLRLVQSGVLLVAALLWLAAYPPRPGNHHFVFAPRETPERIAAMRAAIDLIPPEVPVTVSNRLGAHLSERRAIYQFPLRSASDWIVIDTRDVFLQLGGERGDQAAFRRHLRRLERDTRWVRIFGRAEVRVYRRA